MSWIEEKIRGYLDGPGGGAQAQHSRPRTSPTSNGRPALDYLTAKERRVPQPSVGPEGFRMDRSMPDDYFIASRNGPDWFFRRMRTDIPAKQPWRIHLGMLNGSWGVTFADNHVLAIAPPRSTAGKTAALMVPAILSHPNPVVTASTKTDVMTATAMARAQYGKLWCYAPTSDREYIPEGVTELRWSPIARADSWDMAVATAEAMTGILDAHSMRNGDHWKERAADLLAPVFHWAALVDATMRDARDAVYGHVSELPGIVIALQDRGAHEAAHLLGTFIDGNSDEIAAVASTAARALKGYRTEGALRSTENPNFDPVDFVNGGPLSVRADTVYIAARGDEQELVAPLVVGLLTQIQRDVYRRHRRLAAAGLEHKEGAAPILFALDELYGLAPLPNLPSMLSEGGSQGLLIVAAIQDLTLIKKRWRDEADAFLTMFGHTLVYPGIRDIATLEAVSKLHGDHLREKRESNVKKSPAEHVPTFLGEPPAPLVDNEESARIASDWRPVLSPHEVMTGVNPGNHDELILFGPGAVGRVTATPYHRAAPWPMLLTAYLERALSGRVPEWRYWESTLSHEQPDCEDTLPRLPVPRLDEWAEAATANRAAHPCDRAWAARYTAALRERERVLSQAPRRVRWEHGWTIGTHAFEGSMWVVTAPAGRIAPEAASGGETSRQRPDGPSETPTIARSEPGRERETPDPIPAVTQAASAAPDIDDKPMSPPERWEPDWGPDEDRTMRRWAGTGQPPPDCFQSNLKHMVAAVSRERERRQEMGDLRSVELYEQQKARLLNGGRHNKSAGHGLDEIVRANTRGFWALLPAGIEELNTAFLRGEDLGALYGDGPTYPSLEKKPDGISDERWREIVTETEQERARRVTR